MAGIVAAYHPMVAINTSHTPVWGEIMDETVH
eukprot:COSAG05_NODE_11674_length_502_cov_2.091811_1_plen_31_part_10